MEKVQGGSLANLSGNSFEAFTEKVLLNLKINEDSFAIYIYFLPKFSDKKEKIFYINELREEDNEFKEYKIFFQRFVNTCYKFYFKTTKINVKDISKTKKDIYFLDFLKDQILLKSIFKKLQNLKIPKERKIIYSDLIIGEIDYDINAFNNDSNVVAQKIKVSNTNLYKVINSYLKAKFTPYYLSLLSKDELIMKEQFSEILFLINKIKSLTTYDKRKTFIPKERLKPFLLDNKEMYKNNLSLFRDLEELLLNKMDYNKTLNYFRQTLPMDKIWEGMITKYLKENYPEVNTQVSKDFFLNKKLKMGNSSRPDNIVNDTVIDAKYKILEKIKDSDIDKLIRDMVVHGYYKGQLIYIKMESEGNEIEFFKNELEMFFGFEEAEIKIVKMPFLFYE